MDDLTSAVNTCVYVRFVFGFITTILSRLCGYFIISPDNVDFQIGLPFSCLVFAIDFCTPLLPTAAAAAAVLPLRLAATPVVLGNVVALSTLAERARDNTLKQRTVRLLFFHVFPVS